MTEFVENLPITIHISFVIDSTIRILIEIILSESTPVQNFHLKLEDTSGFIFSN